MNENKNGDIEIGKFNFSKLDGYGIKIPNNGKIINGVFKNHQLIEQYVKL